MIKNPIKPLLIYGTRHSTLYNLTPFNQPTNLTAIQLSYGDFHDYKKTLQGLPEHMSIKKFLNYPQNTLTYLSPYSFSKPDCYVSSQNGSYVKIKCKNGYANIDANEYDKMIQLLKPDYIVGLTEYPYLTKDREEENSKNIKRAMRKTKNYLQKSRYFSKSHEQKQSEIIKIGKRVAAIHIGKNLNEVEKNLKEVLEYEVHGVVVCDLCENETLSERQSVFERIVLILEKEMGERKIQLILAGLGKLHDIQHALKYGFQAFQVNYPFLMAEKSIALIWNQGKSSEKNPQKQQDLRPLDPNCTCSTCQNYSETYLSYLIQGNQLNAKILLSIHNLHIYTKWSQQFN